MVEIGDIICDGFRVLMIVKGWSNRQLVLFQPMTETPYAMHQRQIKQGKAIRDFMEVEKEWQSLQDQTQSSQTSAQT